MTSMTRMHFEFIAAVIRNWVPEADRNKAAHDVADDLAYHSPRFNRQRFIEAARGPDMQEAGPHLSRAALARMQDEHWTSTQSDGEVGVRISVPRQEGGER